jgi:hypothetical protein
VRIRIPYVIDVIFVSDPEQIKRIEASGDVDRLHRYATAALPWWVRFYFGATRFHDAARDLWFLALEPASDPGYERRRAYLSERVATRYTRADVDKVARLLQARTDDEELAYELAQVVDRRFVGEEIPRSITTEARRTLQTFGEALLPWKYVRARRAQRDVTDYCAHAGAGGGGGDGHVVDVAHNIGTVAKTLTRALRMVAADLETPVERLFTAHPLTLEAPRIAVRSSRLGGLLRSSMRPGWTVVIFKIGAAATETRDLFFTFGSGGPGRACVFMDFFLAFAADVQGALRGMQSARPPEPSR